MWSVRFREIAPILLLGVTGICPGNSGLGALKYEQLIGFRFFDAHMFFDILLHKIWIVMFLLNF